MDEKLPYLRRDNRINSLSLQGGGGWVGLISECTEAWCKGVGLPCLWRTARINSFSELGGGV